MICKRVNQLHLFRSSNGFLPKQSPWLNPIEPKWVHGKRNVIELVGSLTSKQLAERICAYYLCSYESHLVIPEQVS
jgi:hypothetical protein